MWAVTIVGEFMKAAIDKEFALEALMQLLRIEGPPGGETAVRDAIADLLLQCGARDEWISFDDAGEKIPLPCETGNMVVRIPGTREDGRILFAAHMDTVELAVGAKPRREGPWITSEGACALGADDRAGVAVLVALAEAVLSQEVQRPPITLLFTVREEGGTWGARFVDIASLGGPETGFSYDGSDANKIIIGAPSSDKFTITVTGKSAHAGNCPEKGVSAAEIAAEAIHMLREEGMLGKVRKPEGCGTSNVGVMQGGYGSNVVMPSLTIKAETRSHDPKFQEQLTNAFKDAFARAATSVKNVDGESGAAEFDIHRCYNSFKLAEDSPAVNKARAAIRAAGMEPVCEVSNGGLDACWLNQYGIPTVTLGAGAFDGHSPTERLNVPVFMKACDVALAIATTERE